MFRTRKNTGRFAILFLAVMSIWQVMVLHHMLVTFHSLDTAPRDSAFHLAFENKAPLHTGDEVDSSGHSRRGNSHRTHHCPFLDSITITPGVITPTIHAPVLHRIFYWTDVTPPAVPWATQQSVLDYAPATSPPGRSFA
jgi:hypothetical protein